MRKRRPGDPPTREMRSQGRTLQKYFSMLRGGVRWDKRNILGLRSFLQRSHLDSDRLVLLNEVLQEANAGRVRMTDEFHADSVAYIVSKACNGLGQLHRNARFTQEQLDALRASKEMLLMGFWPNPRRKGYWLSVYRAQGPKGAVTFISDKYTYMKVLGFDPDCAEPSSAGQPDPAVKAAARARAEVKRRKGRKSA